MSHRPNTSNQSLAPTSPNGAGTMSQHQSPSMGPVGRMPHAQQGIDIWGPLQRRKYLVVLICIIGTALGYLYYSKTAKVYASVTKIMITTQAPPTMVDGNFKVDTSSLPKHVSLLGSELVLANAAANGKFSRMETFQGTPFPVEELRRMVHVETGDSEETLVITCRGPVASELASILNQIVASYKSIIDEDSQSVGAQTADLIQKLASRLSDEKESAEEQRLELWRKLGVNTINANGQVVNPYDKKLFMLVEEQEDFKRQLRETQTRAKQLASSLKVDEETGLIDALYVKIAALEAQKYLNLDRAAYQDQEVAHSLRKVHKKRDRLEERAWALDTGITDLRFQKVLKSEVFGSGHSSIEAIEKQIEFYEQQKNDLLEEAKSLSAIIAEEEADPDLPPEVEVIDESTFRENENREWITMYQLALEREQARLVSSLNAWNLEIENVSRSAEEIAAGIVQLNLLQGQIDEKRRAVGVIIDRLSEMNVLASNYTRTKVRTLDEPKYGQKIAPSLPKSLGLGAILGFLVGLGLAIIVDQSELAFRSPHEVFERLQVPVVGRVPRINTRAINPEFGHAAMVVAHKPGSTAAESFRDVRTGLFFRSQAEDLKTILFTSPSPGDGKSTVVGNMAVSIAQAGKRVILVDADFRRPRLHQYLGEEINPGLLDVLSGEMSLKEAIQKSQLQENMYLLTSGGRPKNPGELVTSDAFRDLIEALREKFDYVLIDSPPVLPVSDPATIASIVDGVYIVTRIRKGIKLTAQKAKETLDRVGAHWMGIIVNGIDENPHYSEYGYQYGNFSYYVGVYGRYYDLHNKAYRDKIANASEDSNQASDDQSVESI